MGGSTAKSTVYLYAEFVLLVLARLLLKKLLNLCPMVRKRQSPRVGDRLINVILARTTVSYIARRG